ncbi:hypothetical protein [Streptomyces sp. NPDC086777]|uniref:hypothetical protein n=1 Tax=Streptomyces sp. NPDC086777 TaxID=3154866 RepID=UPI00344B6861
MENLCRLQACDRAFNDLVSARLPLHADGREMHDRAEELRSRIMRNAQEQGVLRGDVTAQDIAFVIWSQAGIIQATRTIAPRAWRRHLHLMLDAFRTEGAHELPEPGNRPTGRPTPPSTASCVCTVWRD